MQVTGAGDRVGVHPNQELRLTLRGLHSPEPASAEPSQQVLGMRPHGHSVDVEPAADRDHAVTVLSGGSDRVYFLGPQWCLSPSRWVRHHPRLGFRPLWSLPPDAQSRLLPRGTQSLQPLPRVRGESTGVHDHHRFREAPRNRCFVPAPAALPMLPVDPRRGARLARRLCGIAHERLNPQASLVIYIRNLKIDL